MTGCLFSLLNHATPIYLGTFAGNHQESAVEAAIFSATSLTVDITNYDASDGGPVLTLFTPSNPHNAMSGTWDVIDNSVLISYVTVKASNSFALYQYTPPANSGSWSTIDITNTGGQQPGLSGLRLWTTDNTEVPEPATFALLGLGLVAYSLLLRRRKA